MKAEGLPRAPDLLGHCGDQIELSPLIIHGDDVALYRTGKATLRTDGQMFQGHPTRGLVNSTLQGVFALELTKLGGDQTQDHTHILGNESQGLKVS